MQHSCYIEDDVMMKSVGAEGGVLVGAREGEEVHGSSVRAINGM